MQEADDNQLHIGPQQIDLIQQALRDAQTISQYMYVPGAAAPWVFQAVCQLSPVPLRLLTGPQTPTTPQAGTPTRALPDGEEAPPDPVPATPPPSARQKPLTLPPLCWRKPG